MDLKEIPCPLCNSLKNAVALKTADHNFGVPGVFYIKKCMDCGMCFVSPRPVEIGQIYPEHYANAYKLSNEYLNRREFKRRLRLIKKNIPAGKILEVGCSAGHLLAAIREQGYQVMGLEIDGRTAEFARAAYKLDIINQPLETAELPEKEFDGVVLFDVFEHVSDPSVCLRQIYKTLKPNGKLIIKVPNYGCFESRAWGQFWYGKDVPRHLLHFTEKTVKIILKKNKFTNIRVKHNGEANYAIQSFGKLIRASFGKVHNLKDFQEPANTPTVKKTVFVLLTLLNELPVRFLAFCRQGNSLTVIGEKDIIWT